MKAIWATLTKKRAVLPNFLYWRGRAVRPCAAPARRVGRAPRSAPGLARAPAPPCASPPTPPNRGPRFGRARRPECRASRDGGGPQLLRLGLGLPQRRRHVGPQPGERLLLLGRDLGQRFLVPEAGQVGVLLPLAQRLLHRGAVGGLLGL